MSLRDAPSGVLNLAKAVALIVDILEPLNVVVDFVCEDLGLCDVDMDPILC